MKAASILVNKTARIVFISLLVAAVLSLFAYENTVLPIFELHFNAYALLSASGSITCIGLLFAMSRQSIKTNEGVWIVVLISLVAVFGASEVLQRMSVTPEASNFWGPFQAFSPAFIPLTVVAFTLNYVRPNARHAAAIAGMFLGGIIIYFFQIDSNLIFQSTTAHTHLYAWGFNNDPGVDFISDVLWVFGPVLWSILTLNGFRRRATNPVLKSQATIYIWAFTIPFIGALVGDLGLPLAGITILPPLSALFFTVTAALLYIGLRRYRLFKFSPALFAGDILTTMNEAVVVIGVTNKVEYINAAASKFFAIDTEAAQDKALEVLFGLENSQQISASLVNNGKAEAIELDLKTATGTIPVSLVNSKIDSEGVVMGHILVFRDISRERAAKEVIEREVVLRTRELHDEQAKLKASIADLSLGFIFVDTAGKIVISNLALNKIFGLVNSDLALDELSKKLTNCDLAELCKKAAAEHTTIELKEVNLGVKFLHLYITPVTSVTEAGTTVIGSVILVEDVSEEKILNRSRDEFFSIASHELRTPLTAIKGNSSMIMSFYADSLKDPELKEMVTDIHDSSNRLIDIVSDFLDVSRLEQGKVTYDSTEFGLDTVVESIVYEMKNIIRAKGISLTFDKMTLGKLPKVWADQNRTKQVLYNLVGNALKFTEKGSIDISTAVEGDFIKLIVTDTGRGIPEQAQQLLFRKFQQAGGSLLTRDTTRGTGLGLYISKIITENMGGQIKLEKSEEGKGSSFSVTLPIATEARKKAAVQSTKTDINTDTGLSTTTTKAGELDKAKV